MKCSQYHCCASFFFLTLFSVSDLNANPFFGEGNGGQIDKKMLFHSTKTTRATRGVEGRSEWEVAQRMRFSVGVICVPKRLCVRRALGGDGGGGSGAKTSAQSVRVWLPAHPPPPPPPLREKNSNFLDFACDTSKSSL